MNIVGSERRAGRGPETDHPQQDPGGGLEGGGGEGDQPSFERVHRLQPAVHGEGGAGGVSGSALQNTKVRAQAGSKLQSCSGDCFIVRSRRRYFKTVFAQFLFDLALKDSVVCLKNEG